MRLKDSGSELYANKLSTWFWNEIRMQEEVTVRIFIILSYKWWKRSNILVKILPRKIVFKKNFRAF